MGASLFLGPNFIFDKVSSGKDFPQGDYYALTVNFVVELTFAVGDGSGAGRVVSSRCC